MDRLLILYPELFRCKSKFDRKVQNLTSTLKEFTIVHQGDPNGFIHDYSEQDSRIKAVEAVANWKEEARPSHAIIFDDGEEFPEERDWLMARKIPMRLVLIPITRVINIKREPEHQKQKGTSKYEYIGRGSYWGNPHSMYEKGESREEVIRKYKYDFDHDLFIKIKISKIHELAGKRLGCFCKPASCHGDVLAEFLNSYDDGR